MTAKRQQPRWFYLFAALLFLVLLGLNARDYLQGDPAGDRVLDLFLCGMDGLIFFLLLARFMFRGQRGPARDRLLEGCLDLLLLAAWAFVPAFVPLSGWTLVLWIVLLAFVLATAIYNIRQYWKRKQASASRTT